ncbi:MAG TPA: hypothetical protein VN908_12460 [Gemmatimonadales bacterium]|nr:hypothetical protein [Gemmatimonadales bacterium]
MPNNDEMLHALERMNKLLALVAVKGVENKEAVLTLLRAGYTQAEVASLLDMKVSAVSMIVLRHKEKVEAEKAKKPTKAPKAATAAAAATDGEGE